MVTITCDVCGKKKPEESTNGGGWILGYDLQSESSKAVSRSIRFLDHWDDRRVLELGTIHLCSEKCRQNYLRGERAA